MGPNEVTIQKRKNDSRERKIVTFVVIYL